MYFFNLPAGAGVGDPKENEKPGFAIFQSIWLDFNYKMLKVSLIRYDNYTKLTITQYARDRNCGLSVEPYITDGYLTKCTITSK